MKDWIFFALFALMLSCDINSDNPVTPPQQPVQPVDTGNNLGIIDQSAYTFQSKSGNKVVDGKGSVGERMIDVELKGKPSWLAAISSGDFSFWVAVLEDGRVEAVVLRPDFEVASIQMNVDKVPVGMPPTLGLDSNERPLIIKTEDENTASQTSPLVLSSGEIVQLDDSGNLILGLNDESQTLAIDALPDARIVCNSDEELAVLTNPTTEYRHAVLGDDIEARSVTVIATKPTLQIIKRIEMPDQAVIEGVSPIWADADEDGQEELLVTLSNNKEGSGAKLVLFDKDGTIKAEGPLSPGGWRHQLAVFQPGNGEPMVIVDCQKPHVQRILNFYRLKGSELVISASKTGYSTHLLGLRNLDMAVAGDFDGDGTREILVPSTNGQEVRSVILSGGELLENTLWSAGGKISTNFAATTLDGNLIFGVGTENENLRIWVD